MRLSQLVLALRAEVRAMGENALSDPLFSFNEVQLRCLASVQNAESKEIGLTVGPLNAQRSSETSQSEQVEVTLTLRLLNQAERLGLQDKIDEYPDGSIGPPVGIGGLDS